MFCCGCCFKSRDDKPELDGMGQSNKGPSMDEQYKEESEGTGDHNVQSALDVGTSVRCADSSQDEREEELEEGEKLRVGTPHSATQHTPTESNSESKEPDNGLQRKLISSTPSVVESCADAPTAGCSDNRDSPSLPPAPPAVPHHVISQVREHCLTRSFVSGGGAASGSGSEQQLVSPLKPQADSSDSHQWQSDGTPPPASPGDDGSHAHSPDGLSNRATANEKEEDGGGSHLKDKGPPQGCGTVEGRTEEPTGLLHERKATGPEPTPANESDVEPLTGTAPDTASPEVELEEGLDSNKQQQGEAGNQGRWPGTAQRVQTGSGSDQQLVSPPKPQGDSSHRHQWQSDGTIPLASPGDDGSHAHSPDGLSNRATAEEEEEEDGGGSHLKDKAPPQGCGTVEGRTEEPTGLLHERKATGPEPTPANESDMEPLTSTDPDTAFPGEELEEGLDFNKQQQGEAGNQGRWPGTAQRGNGSDQQLVSPLKPCADSSDRYPWQSDGTTPPASPGDDGSHAHTPDGLSNRATADKKEEEGGGGSHLKDKAPPQDCGTGRAEEPTGLLHEREATGPEPTAANESDVEPLTGTAPDTVSPGEELGEGLDSNMQQQGEAGNQGRSPGTAQRVQTPPISGAEDLPTPVKCVDCNTQLSAEEIQHRKEQGEALLCDTCRSAHLRCVQGDSDSQGLLDQASEDTRPSPEVVPEGPMCKLPGCPKQAQVKGKYYEFCSKGHYQMYDMMTPSPVPLKPSTSQRSPTSPTAPSHSGEGLSCQYPGCSEVCAVEGSGRPLACCDVHHKEEERQLRQFQEGSGSQRGDSGQSGDNGGQRGDSGQNSDSLQRGSGGGQRGDSGGQRGDSHGQSSDNGGQRGDSGQNSDSGHQKGDSGGQRGDSGGHNSDSRGQSSDNGGQRGDSGQNSDSHQRGEGGGQNSDSGHQKGDSGGHNSDSRGQSSDNGGQKGDSGGQNSDSHQRADDDGQKGDIGGQRGDSGCQESHGGYQTAGSGGQRSQHNPHGNYSGPGRRDRSNRGGGHTPQPHPPAIRPKTCWYPGCQRSCYVERDGRVHDFCGRTHADRYRAEQTRSSRAAWSHHTEDESQGVLGWMAGKVSAIWGSSSHSTSGSHGNPGNHGKRGSSAIKFYNKHEPYYEFTNFYQAPLQIDGKVWATSENYFQAQKYIGTPLYDAIQQSQTAREAFDISRTPGLGLQWRRCDWEAVKEDVMYVALYAKFTQHEQLTKMLLNTGDHKLVEHTTRDSYWGDGGDGSGQNRLGKLLMKLREELRKLEMEAVSKPVSQGGRKRRNEGGGEGAQSRAKKVSSDASDTGSSVD